MFSVFCVKVGTLQVYHQNESTADYLHQTDLPELSQFTICLWLKRMGTPPPTSETIVSIYVAG